MLCQTLGGSCSTACGATCRSTTEESANKGWLNFLLASSASHIFRLAGAFRAALSVQHTLVKSILLLQILDLIFIVFFKVLLILKFCRHIITERQLALVNLGQGDKLSVGLLLSLAS